ncbi:hypothetical protein NGTWS1702_04240 [Mycolicibacterium cyprinidarum]|uniref:DUF222 domain-containing protein n=1 Tax=Mycolicibacterium cyprinidarum TaxID=2860311 RepID=A0ABQ4V676_9MYCO|nr:hypothetical protein NGTWS1702_04240 [Mycolicibacterium sp. NGTWSNA01]
MANDAALPVPPKGTRQNGASLWYSMLARYTFEQYELTMLREAVRSVDELDRLADVIARSRAVTPSGGFHPAMIEARQLRITLTTLLAALRLPGDNGDTPVSVSLPQQPVALTSVPALPPRGGLHRQAQAHDLSEADLPASGLLSGAYQGRHRPA